MIRHFELHHMRRDTEQKLENRRTWERGGKGWIKQDYEITDHTRTTGAELFSICQSKKTWGTQENFEQWISNKIKYLTRQNLS